MLYIIIRKDLYIIDIYKNIKNFTFSFVFLYIFFLFIWWRISGGEGNPVIPCSEGFCTESEKSLKEIPASSLKSCFY